MTKRSTRPTKFFASCGWAIPVIKSRANCRTGASGSWKSPKVLLLDEPAAGVPPEESGDIFEAVASLSDDLTLLFIEHDMHVVFRFASHIIVLVGGAIFTEGTPAEIAADPGVREVYLGKRKHG